MTETKPRDLPPDDALIALAILINAKLPHGVRVNFWRIQHESGHFETGVIYQCGSARTIVKTREMLTEHNAAEIARAAENWAGRQRQSNRWTTDLSEAG